MNDERDVNLQKILTAFLDLLRHAICLVYEKCLVCSPTYQMDTIFLGKGLRIRKY